MFISSKGKLYFKDGANFREVKKSCEKLIISSTSTDKVEEVDRVFETNEILRKTNSQIVEFEEPKEIIEEVKDVEVVEPAETAEATEVVDVEVVEPAETAEATEVVDVEDVVEEAPVKKTQGKPATKSKTKEAE